MVCVGFDSSLRRGVFFTLMARRGMAGLGAAWPGLAGQGEVYFCVTSRLSGASPGHARSA